MFLQLYCFVFESRVFGEFLSGCGGPSYNLDVNLLCVWELLLTVFIFCIRLVHLGPSGTSDKIGTIYYRGTMRKTIAMLLI